MEADGAGTREDFSYIDCGGSSGENDGVGVSVGKDAEALNFWDCNLGDRGVESLCSEIIKLGPSAKIKRLNLWGNSIGDSGCKALARVLGKEGPGLVRVDLWNNQIGDKGAKLLADALRHNTLIVSLNLWQNKIGEEGASELLAALKTNASLTSMDLGRCEVPEPLLDLIEKSLIDRPSLQANRSQNSSKSTKSAFTPPSPAGPSGFDDETFSESGGWGDSRTPPASSSDDDSELLLAVWRGDSKAVAALLEPHYEGINRLYSGRSLLHRACEFGHVKVAAALLELKAEVDCVDHRGKTALYKASAGGHEDTVRLLMDNKANVCREDRFRLSPLDVATERVRPMMENEAIRMRNAEAAFLTACGGGHIEEAQRLLESGVWVDARGKDGFTGLMMAAQKGLDSVVEGLVLAKANTEATEIDGWSALHYACREGNLSVVVLLLRSKADPNSCDRDQFSALHAAAEVGRVDIVSALVSNGADLSVVESEGKSALHIASDNGGDCGPDLVETLLDMKASPLIKDKAGKTALHWAAPFASTKTVKLLLDADADPKETDNRGWTALHCAVADGNIDVIEQLLEAKSDPAAKDKEGKAPLHLAAAGGYDELLALLADFGVDLSVVDDNRQTALHFACAGGHDEMAQQLLEWNCDPLAQDSRKQTPLHAAVLGGNEFCVEVLLESGGGIEAASMCDCDRKTPYALAVDGENEDIPPIFEEFDCAVLPEPEPEEGDLEHDGEGKFLSIPAAAADEESGKIDLGEAKTKLASQHKQEELELQRAGQLAEAGREASAAAKRDVAAPPIQDQAEPETSKTDKAKAVVVTTAAEGAEQQEQDEQPQAVVKDTGVTDDDVTGQEPAPAQPIKTKQLKLEVEPEHSTDFEPQLLHESERRRSSATIQDPTTIVVSTTAGVGRLSFAVLGTPETPRFSRDASSPQSSPSSYRGRQSPRSYRARTLSFPDENSIDNRPSDPYELESPPPVSRSASLPSLLRRGRKLSAPTERKQPYPVRMTASLSDTTAAQNPLEMKTTGDKNVKAVGKELLPVETKKQKQQQKQQEKKQQQKQKKQQKQQRTHASDLKEKELKGVDAKKKKSKSPFNKFKKKPFKYRTLPGPLRTQSSRPEVRRSCSSSRLVRTRTKMMKALDTRNPDIQRVWESLNRSTSDTNWMVMATRAESNALELIGYGPGGLREFVNKLAPDRVMWGIVKVQTTSMQGRQKQRKLVFFTHIGEKVTAFARAKATVRTPQVMVAFNNIAVHLQDSSVYDEDSLGRVLMRNSTVEADSYDFGPEQSIKVSELKKKESYSRPVSEVRAL